MKSLLLSLSKEYIFWILYMCLVLHISSKIYFRWVKQYLVFGLYFSFSFLFCVSKVLEFQVFFVVVDVFTESLFFSLLFLILSYIISFSLNYFFSMQFTSFPSLQVLYLFCGFGRSFSIKINPFISTKCMSLNFLHYYIFSKLLICRPCLWNPTNPTSFYWFYWCQKILFVYEVKAPQEAVVFHSVVKYLICFEAFDCLQVILHFMPKLAVPLLTWSSSLWIRLTCQMLLGTHCLHFFARKFLTLFFVL